MENVFCYTFATLKIGTISEHMYMDWEREKWRGSDVLMKFWKL